TGPFTTKACIEKMEVGLVNDLGPGGQQEDQQEVQWLLWQSNNPNGTMDRSSGVWKSGHSLRETLDRRHLRYRRLMLQPVWPLQQYLSGRLSFGSPAAANCQYQT